MRGIVLTHRKRRYLLLADTHVGYEVELRARGVNVVSQTHKLVRGILGQAEVHGVDAVFILGDVKHELPVPRESVQEVREFLRSLSVKVPTILIPGNHDSMLEEVARGIEGVEIAPSRGIMLGRYLLLHGHMKPNPEDLAKAKVVVMGHTHPAVAIRDGIGYVAREPALLRITVNKGELMRSLYGEEAPGASGELKIVVLPASHPLITGVHLEELPRLSAEGKTLLKYVKWDPSRVEVYLHDLTFLGTAEELAAQKP